MKWLAAGVLALLSSLASAQGFPERPVRLIVALPPGGSPDLMARTIAQGPLRPFRESENVRLPKS